MANLVLKKFIEELTGTPSVSFVSAYLLDIRH